MPFRTTGAISGDRCRTPATQHDDGILALDPNNSVDAGVGSLGIDLPCGNYYLANVHTSNPVTVLR